MTKRLLPLALLSFAFLAACGDDDSSFAPHDEDSSSSICEDCDDESSSSKKQGDGGSEAAMTSSSAKSSSSERETSVSSSSAKSSSSEKENSTSSSSSLNDKSSSSQAFVPNWEDGDDGEIRRDDSTGIAFKYDAELDQWVKAQTNDTTLNLQGCTTRREGEMHKITSRNQYYICKKSNWVLPSTLVIDTYGKNCTEAEIGTFITGAEVDTNSYYCAASGWVSVKGRWGWDVPKEARQNQNTVYGTMTDKRDGQVYKTVKIGDQVWMAENLNYADNEKTPSIKGKSWCFGNDSTKCLVTGRLYTWAAAIDSVALANDAESPMECGFNIECLLLEKKLQGICPDGWRLPTQTDFETLFEAVGGTANAGTVLKTTTGWYYNYKDGNGTDDYGFSGLPAGGRSTEGQFSEDGRQTCFWSSVGDKSDDRRAQCMYLEYYDEKSGLWNPYKSYGYPVRCVQDKDTAPSSSSEAIESSSSEYIPYDHKNDLFEDSLNSGAYKKFTDIRNGRSYYYLTINAKDGDEDVSVTVMAENLNIGIDVPGTEDQSDDENIERYCYNDDTTNCDKYGGLYQWAEMMQLPSRCNVDACEDLIEENHRGICPEGWHVLTYDEYVIVLTANKEEKNIRAISFGGDNLTGYSLIGAGHNRNHQFADLNNMTFWFYPENGTMSEPSAFSGYQLKSSAGMDFTSSRKSYANSVRCVKD